MFIVNFYYFRLTMNKMVIFVVINVFLLLFYLQSYAESTIKEMLGWYGLHDQPIDGITSSRGTPPSDLKRNNGNPDSPVEGTTVNGWDRKVGCQPLSTSEGNYVVRF